MEIEYIYPENSENNPKNRPPKQQDTLGCLLVGLAGLVVVFIFLTLLPIILVILGYSIAFLTLYIVYKVYLELPVLSLIEKLKARR